METNTVGGGGGVARAELLSSPLLDLNQHTLSCNWYNNNCDARTMSASPAPRGIGRESKDGEGLQNAKSRSYTEGSMQRNKHRNLFFKPLSHNTEAIYSLLSNESLNFILPVPNVLYNMSPWQRDVCF